ncbi:hypothetical protein G6M89_14815 [Natronolimnobius sp. AArcel1]|uniref:hypothetical protein n=1 Tax=Natronolimnobius sp. AArcel1 TaxID=1679093 RepID=UPI0013ECF30C|nr:hypothetical protein [Natronolimnobius sp. AArcel1]NGM70266.1 hypothetical protein [Natronolimnobius sp. AArcel1]
MGEHYHNEDDTTSIKDNYEERGDSWRSQMIRDAAGNPLGVGMFLTAEDLEELGVNTESSEEVHYRIVEGGFIKVSEND